MDIVKSSVYSEGKGLLDIPEQVLYELGDYIFGTVNFIQDEITGCYTPDYGNLGSCSYDIKMNMDGYHVLRFTFGGATYLISLHALAYVNKTGHHPAPNTQLLHLCQSKCIMHCIEGSPKNNIAMQKCEWDKDDDNNLILNCSCMNRIGVTCFPSLPSTADDAWFPTLNTRILKNVEAMKTYGGCLRELEALPVVHRSDFVCFFCFKDFPSYKVMHSHRSRSHRVLKGFYRSQSQLWAKAKEDFLDSSIDLVRKRKEFQNKEILRVKIRNRIKYRNKKEKK